MSDHSCPKCGDSFPTERGMKSHYGQKHDGSISGREVRCEVCGEDFRKLPSRIKNDDHHTCSPECRVELVSELVSGEDHYDWIEDRMEICQHCGSRYDCVEVGGRGKFCSLGCRNEHYKTALTGEDNPNWRGGSPKYYGEEWYKIRESIRSRDGDICQRCGAEWGDLERRPSVHHITPVRTFDNVNDAHRMDNCVQVCQACHMELENMSEKRQRKELSSSLPNSKS